MICQKSTSEVLRCPCKDPRNPGVTGAYQAFAARFQELRSQAGSEPKKHHFKLHNLFDNSTLPDIAAEMLSKQGKWHKACYNLFSSTQVTRAGLLRKRTLPDSVADEPMGPTDPGGSLNDQGPRKFLRAASLDHDHEKCIFCQEHSSDSPLRKIASYDCGTRFYEIANVLQFEPLLTILTYADHGKKGVEYNMKYHDDCSTSMFNQYKSYNRKQASMDSNSSIPDQHVILAARAFSNLTHHIEKLVDDGEHRLTFPHLVRVHNEYRETLGIPSVPTGKASDQGLKEKLGLYFEGEADWVKRDDKTNSVCFHSGLRNDDVSPDNAFKIIGDAGKIIREAIFKHGPTYDFENQQFKAGTQQSSVPHVLLALVGFILFPGLAPDQIGDSQATLTIAQLLQSNAKRNVVTTLKTRKNIKQETPLPLFLSLKVYHETRSMKLVQLLYDYGLGVTPDRVSDVCDDIAVTLSEAFREINQVVPRRLAQGEVVVFHVDNVDVRTVSTHAKGEFHGTAITVMQPNCKKRDLTTMGHHRFQDLSIVHGHSL